MVRFSKNQHFLNWYVKALFHAYYFTFRARSNSCSKLFLELNKLLLLIGLEFCNTKLFSPQNYPLNTTQKIHLNYIEFVSWRARFLRLLASEEWGLHLHMYLTRVGLGTSVSLWETGIFGENRGQLLNEETKAWKSSEAEMQILVVLVAILAQLYAA